MKITKAIFPVAGLGSRFLPATKASPKEMLTIVDKPAIQYAVEEAIAAGIKELIFVTSNTKRAIEDHFDTNLELETILRERNKNDLADLIHNIIPDDVSCVYIRQKSPRGLGDAVLTAKPLISDEPFAVILADMLLTTEPENCLKNMFEALTDDIKSIIAVQQVPQQQIKNFGIVDTNGKDDKLNLIQNIIEKPDVTHAPSDYGVIGRYVFTPEIFTFLANLKPDRSQEIQLTDAIAELIKQHQVYAYRYQGERFDTGNKLGYLAATLWYGSHHPQLGDEFKALIKQFSGELHDI